LLDAVVASWSIAGIVGMKLFGRPSKADSERSSTTVDDEARALNKIINLCSVGETSARTTALGSHGEDAKAERQRFESAKRMALQLAKEIKDASCRDAALEHIVELCMKANDLETARILIGAIQTNSIRERLLEEYPMSFY
jgi:uncharacterized small protein (DUF1192 family)